MKQVFEGEKQITYDSKLERYSEMKRTETQVKVLGNSVAAIMALLAALNYFNMMAASVQNRSREFATLESIGMTSGQIRKMLVLEGSGYAVVSIIISVILGLPLSHAVFEGMNIYRIDYSMPWPGNLLLFAGILILCMTVPAAIISGRKKTVSSSGFCAKDIVKHNRRRITDDQNRKRKMYWLRRMYKGLPCIGNQDDGRKGGGV